MGSGKKSPAKTKPTAPFVPPAPAPAPQNLSQIPGPEGRESRSGVHVQWRGRLRLGAPLCTGLRSGLGTGRGRVTGGSRVRARRSDTDGAQAPRTHSK